MARFTNKEVAELLRKVAKVYTVQDVDIFRIRAYERAADAVEELNTNIVEVWENDQLRTIPGIGGSIAQHLDELFTTGTSEYLDKIISEIPEAVFPLTKLQGVGIKSAFTLATELQLNDIETVYDDLLAAARSGDVADIEGFGERSQQNLIESIEACKASQGQGSRTRVDTADRIAQQYIAYLLTDAVIAHADPLGSLRRRAATVGDLDIGLVVPSGKEQDAVDHFLRYPGVGKVLNAGLEKASVLLKNGFQVDIKLGTRDNYGSLLQHFTGSKHHNIALRERALRMGYSLSEYGIKTRSRRGQQNQLTTFGDEKNFYRYLQLDWIPPELREDNGEIDAASRGELPELVGIEDIRGDLHIHSDFDIHSSHDIGRSSLSEIVATAKKHHYQYIGISDHNPSVSKHSKSDMITLMKERNTYIDQCENREEIRILKLLEIDILADKTLSVPDSVLELLDGAIASIHSAFSQDSATLTERILTAITHPKIRIIGHPTGRLIQERSGYELDWERIFTVCKEHEVALEINSQPARLDLPARLVKEAVRQDVTLIINTDAHQASDLDLMRFGVDVARRGWAEKANIINTREVDDFIAWLKES